MNRPEVDRRRFLTSASIASLTALAGCSGIIGETNEEANPYNNETETPPAYLDTGFQYYFKDADGFNQVGGDVPADAGDHQVVDSFVNRSDKVDTWQKMRTNDHHKARLLLDNTIDPGAGDDYEGSVKAIVQKTEELFQNWPENEKEFEQKYGSDIAGIALAQIEEIEDKAEQFTMALRGASAIVSGHNNSAAANYLNTNLAEYTLQQLDIDIPGYKLSTLWTAIDTIYEEPEEKANFSHPIGFLQYQDEEGNQKAKHFELENSVWRNTYGHSANLENSVYSAPLDEEYTDAAASAPTPEYESNNFLSALDYKRGRELEERGELSENFDRRMLNALNNMVDDAPQYYDYDEETNSGADRLTPNQDFVPVISDSFGESVQDYAKNPTTQEKKYLDGTSRAIFSAMDKTGWNKPVALDGTIETPEIFYAPEQVVEQIHTDRAYDNVRQRVLSA